MKPSDIPLFQTEIDRLTRTVQTFLDTGVCILERDYTRDGVTFVPEPSLRKFVRYVAKELKRPFISAECTTYYPWDGLRGRNKNATITTPTCLTIPKLKNLASIYAGLMLVCGETIPRWGAANPDRLNIWRRDTNSTMMFYFAGDGLEVFEKWVEQCRTDPVFRIALRIP